MKILAARSGDAPVFMAISSSSRLKIGTRNLSVIFKQSLNSVLPQTVLIGFGAGLLYCGFLVNPIQS